MRAHRFLFLRHGRASVAAATGIYALVILTLGPVLAISNNYFVALPVIVSALSGGIWAGLAAGALGLPANLLLFAAIGHPEFSPASKPIAEGFGILVGFSLGYLAEYFRGLEAEIHRRAETEESLRRTLLEKELLLKELHHRVKNNLNVIKSLVKLQRNRSEDPAFVAASDELVNRILAIALVHDQLYGGDSPLVEPRAYLETIAANVSSAFGAGPGAVAVEVDIGGRVLPADLAVPLGLVANEALTNAMKHARLGGPGAVPPVRVALRMEGERYLLSVLDDGPVPAAGTDSGLGMKIVRAFASQLGGVAVLGAGPSGGALLEMRWPAGEAPPTPAPEPSARADI